MNIKSVNDKKKDVQAMEPVIRNKMGKSAAVPEPDYDAMWMRMGLEWKRGGDAASSRGSVSRAPAQMRVRKVAMMTVLGAALAAVPAYAAFQYDWSDILIGREGIQTALAQGLGQTIEQSVTHDGVTLTLHTAFADEGRTLILYSLDLGSKKGKSFDFSRLAITDGNGQRHEVTNTQPSNEDDVIQGYFETDWSPQSSSEAVRFSAEEIGFYENAELPLVFDARNPQPQTTDIARDGFLAVQIQALDQGNGRTLLRTTIMPESGEAGTQAFPQLLVYDRSGNEIRSSQNKMGLPGEGNSTLNDSYYDTTSLLQQGASFKLTYNRILTRSDSSWNFPLVLDKSQVEDAVAKQKLDVTIGEGDEVLKIDKLTISPSQIRLGLREGSGYSTSFAEYKLVVDGRELDRPLHLEAREKSGSSLVLERPAELRLSADSTIELLARHAFITHREDLPEPVTLTNIGENKQTILSQVGGYPVSWTYYRQNGDLYVQTRSDDSNFGGIGQTHIGTGKDKLFTTPIRDGMGSSTTEIYPDYTGDTAEMHIFSYTEHMPDKEVRVQLYPAK